MKKLFSLAAIAFCITFSPAAHAQSNIFFLADNIKGSSTLAANATDVSSMGTSISCNCNVVGAAGKPNPGKIVFNIKNDVLLNTLKSYILKGSNGGTAYLIFSKPTANGGKPGSGTTNYYYIKLTNFTVMEMDESSDGSDNPVQVSLGYSAINWSIKPTLSNGTLGSPQSYGFDFTTGQSNSNSAIPTGF